MFSGNIDNVSVMEKAKFPLHFFPEVFLFFIMHCYVSSVDYVLLCILCNECVVMYDVF